MATIAQKRACERGTRAMLEDHGLPQPDEVEYGHGCIFLIWCEEKVCLEVQIDEPPSALRRAEDVELDGDGAGREVNGVQTLT